MYITALIYKTTVQNRIFNFILTMLLALAFSSTAAVVVFILEYKAIELYIKLYASGIYTPDESV